MINPQDINLKELKVNSASYNPYNKLKFDIIGEDAVKQFLSDKLNRIEKKSIKAEDIADNMNEVKDCTIKYIKLSDIRMEFTLK